MLRMPKDFRSELGEAIRARRIAQGWSQVEAAARGGMGLSTWKRMEAQGPGTVENLISAAIALHCEDGIAHLFPAPAGSGLDAPSGRETADTPKPRRRVSRQKRASLAASGTNARSP